MISLLQQFSISFTNGFLPDYAPLLNLPKDFQIWEEVARQLSPLIHARAVRKVLENMPLLQIDSLQTLAELERAMLLLSCFGHAFIFCPPEEKKYLPASVAVPWVAVSEKLGRPPIVTHASLIAHNWRKIDPKGPMTSDNLATLMLLNGGVDEAWFYLLTMEIEARGAVAIPHILAAQTAIEQDDKPAVADALQHILTTIVAITDLLKRMREYCDPYIFYHRVRPFLSSFENIDYQGVKKQNMRSYNGGSAAQSVLIQVLDVALGIQHKERSSSQFLLRMRQYMPPKQAAFITYVEKNIHIPNFCLKNSSLTPLYKECVAALHAFRQEHLKIVAEYIFAHVEKVGTGHVGTGGTHPMIFLKQLRNDTEVE